jgi:hypothetical protein
MLSGQSSNSPTPHRSRRNSPQIWTNTFAATQSSHRRRACHAGGGGIFEADSSNGSIGRAPDSGNYQPSSDTQHVSITCLRDGKSPISSSVAVAAHATVRSKACSSTSLSTLAEYATSLEEGNLPGVYGIELDGAAPREHSRPSLSHPIIAGRTLSLARPPSMTPE